MHLDFLTNLLPPNLLYYNSIANKRKLIQSYSVNLHKNMWQLLDYNIYGSAFGRPIMEIEKDGIYYNKSRIKCAIINVVDCKETSNEAFIYSALTDIY